MNGHDALIYPLPITLEMKPKVSTRPTCLPGLLVPSYPPFSLSLHNFNHPVTTLPFLKHT